MTELGPNDVPVVCSKCGARTRLVKRTGGYETGVLGVAPDCKHPPVETCERMRIAISAAYATTR
jgi:hypothetical protein